MKAVLFGLLPVFLVACQFAPVARAEDKTPAKPEEKQPVKPDKKTVPPDPAKPQTLIGQPIQKATELADAAKVLNRVVMEDGKPRMVTRDFRPGRLNFTVVKGIVTEVQVEGK